MTVFDMARVTALLNDDEVVGWSDDQDAIMFPNLEMFNTTVGATGEKVFNAMGERGGDVVLKLLPNSPTRKALMRAVARWIEDGSTTVYKLTVTNLDHKTITTCTNGRLRIAPLGQTQGKEAAANAEFTINFAKIVPDWDSANYDPASA